MFNFQEESNVLFVTNNDMVYGFGGNSNGCLDIVQISCGYYSQVLALGSDGRVYAWGNNDSGQFGRGDTNGLNCEPIEIEFAGQGVCTELIGKGGFGAVYKVEPKVDAEVYAIKVVNIPADKRKQVLNEIKSLENVRSVYVVKYYTSWIDNVNNRLYIQMEYCPQSLRSVLAAKALAFGRQLAEPMNLFEYFIAYKIFKQILESVQYLHELDPPVIHRDLKPDNILITNTLSGDNNNSRRFVKLGDFGLATVHDTSRHTDSRYEHSAVGTYKYRAPELAIV
ncbi:unnamed protein product [Medioppia subpectinata]|uniref:Protein kinase domain-containing protein n=1 Tax=Medioppia subpectinata TaxID=1979941 RepID=A0A7R9Q7N6_9ACAR|nr:unnamed protein product [Medioppia subpectinata]CAG2115754.1 unnamed protein product [Medioppia subpectinata]